MKFSRKTTLQCSQMVYTNGMDDFCKIPLTRGQVALVDSSDYEWLSQWKWCAMPTKSGVFYAVRAIREKSKISTVRMAREIMGLYRDDKRQVDHIDPTRTLDNRRSNLRIATDQQNKCNRRAFSKNKTGLNGVSMNGSRWSAQITTGGKTYWLGSFPSPEDAHAAYCVAAKQFYGDFFRP